MNPTPKPPSRELPCDFGRYRLLKLLGRGGMGAVYLAHDAQLDRQVAIKIPHFTPEDGPRPRERFYREARAAATVHHPNVCPVFDVGEVDGTPYLTMAFIEGKPLSHIARARPLTPRQSAALTRKVALALAEAHKKGVVHRDLKPENIMIDQRGEPVIMDFGVARRSRGDARLTQLGDIFGTPAYMAPEQARGDTPAIGPASDIYSLGTMLYELLAGRLPFRGDALAVMVKVVSEAPPPPSAFQPGLDRTLEAICLKALAKKPAERHASMTDLAVALQNYLRGGTAAATVPPPLPLPAAILVEETETLPEGAGRAARDHLTPREPRRPRRKRKPRRSAGVPLWAWLAGAAGLAVLVALIAVLIVARQPAGTGQAATPRETKREEPPPPPPPESREVNPFNGRNLAGWKAKPGPGPNLWLAGQATLDPKNAAHLLVRPGEGMLINQGKGVDLYTEAVFGDCVVELEFMTARGSNSGVYLMGEYEVQIFDHARKGKLTFEDTGGIYGVAAPLGEAARKPGEWQSLVIDFRAPRFEGGRKVANAQFVQVILNGRVVQENLELPKGPTRGGLTGKEAPTGPLMIQGDHGPIALREVRVVRKEISR